MGAFKKAFGKLGKDVKPTVQTASGPTGGSPAIEGSGIAGAFKKWWKSEPNPNAPPAYTPNFGGQPMEMPDMGQYGGVVYDPRQFAEMFEQQRRNRMMRPMPPY